MNHTTWYFCFDSYPMIQKSICLLLRLTLILYLYPWTPCRFDCRCWTFTKSSSLQQGTTNDVLEIYVYCWKFCFICFNGLWTHSMIGCGLFHRSWVSLESPPLWVTSMSEIWRLFRIRLSVLGALLTFVLFCSLSIDVDGIRNASKETLNHPTIMPLANLLSRELLVLKYALKVEDLRQLETTTSPNKLASTISHLLDFRTAQAAWEGQPSGQVMESITWMVLLRRLFVLVVITPHSLTNAGIPCLQPTLL